jgi:hypothetical protein
MLTMTAKRRICSIRRTRPVYPQATDTRPEKRAYLPNLIKTIQISKLLIC